MDTKEVLLLLGLLIEILKDLANWLRDSGSVEPASLPTAASQAVQLFFLLKG
jgi:hypothetical protein